MNSLRTGAGFIFGAAVALSFSFSSQETSSAKTFNRAELRKLGFAGVYRGTVAGRVFFRFFNDPAVNGSLDQSRVVNTGIIERVPPRISSRVPGPVVLAGQGGGSVYTINHRLATGNERRITIRGVYAGFSANGLYPGRTMVGSGNKVLRIVKRGRSNPTFSMTHSSTLYERRNDGVLYSLWVGSGRLQK